MTFLRSVLFNIWFYGITIILATASVIPCKLDRRRAAYWAIRIARFWAQMVLGGLRVICGTRWQVTGLENLPAEGPALVASMHQSAFDTIVWLLLAPRACYVLKRELLSIPLFGMLCRLSGMIAVDRGAGASAIRELLRGADRALGEDRQIIIFPEGTRVGPGERVVLQPGIAALAGRTGLPVIPVVTDSGLFWGRRAFRKRPGLIHVAIGAPIPAGLPRDELMRRLDQVFGECHAALRRG